MTNNEGLSEMVKRCLFQVLAEEIPRIRGSIDGVQQATNETRNTVFSFGQASAKAFQEVTNHIENKVKLITDADS